MRREDKPIAMKVLVKVLIAKYPLSPLPLTNNQSAERSDSQIQSVCFSRLPCTGISARTLRMKKTRNIRFTFLG